MSTPSPLRADRQSLIPGIGCSLLLHGGVGLTWLMFSVLLSYCGPRKPIIDLDKTMEVSMVVLPKSETSVPDRAQRAPVPKGSDAPETAPVEKPPVESDLSYKTEEAEENEGTDVDRQQMLEEIERQKMLEDLMNAPEGSSDRNATDPNSDSDIAINAMGSGSRGDPEFAAYIAKVQAIFQQHFKPLGAVTADNPNLMCAVFVQVDPDTGRITAWEVQQSSGIPSYDAAAERAVTDVGAIPLPPDKFLGLVAEGYVVRFRPP